MDYGSSKGSVGKLSQQHVESTASTRRRWIRRGALLLLAAAVILVEAGLVYYLVFFSSPVYPDSQAVEAEWSHGYLTVSKILDPVAAGGLRKGDRILSVVLEGRELPLLSPSELPAVARAVHFGEAFQIKVLRTGRDGRARVLLAALPAVPKSSSPGIWRRLTGMASNLLIFLACLAAALLIGLTRPEDEGAFVASLLFICFGALTWHGNMEMFPPLPRELALALWMVLYAYVTPVLFWFCLRFPSPSPIDRRFPWLKRAGMVFGLVFGVWNSILFFIQISDQGAYTQYLHGVQYADWVLDVIFCLLAVVGLVALIVNERQARSQDERRRLRILLCGILGLFPWMAVYLYTVTVGGGQPLWVHLFVALSMLLFPVAFLYAVLRHRVFGIRVFLRRGIKFALLSKGFLVLEGGVIFTALYYAAGPPIARIAGKSHGGVMAVAVAGITVAGVIGIRRVNGKVMVPIERRFFREAYDARRILTNLTVDLRQLIGDVDALVWTVVDAVSQTLHPCDASVFLRADALTSLPLSGDRRQTILAASRGTEPDTLLCFWRREARRDTEVIRDLEHTWPLSIPAGPVAGTLLASAGTGAPAVSLDPKDHQSASRFLELHGSPQEKEILAENLKTRLLLPLTAGGKMLGFLALGEKLSEEPYSREDIDLLRALALQMGDTLDHARLLHQSEKQKQILREVEIAQQVQRNLLPSAPPAVPGLDYAGACRPARYVGGDYFDFIRSGESGIALTLGDISGKGISAALLMATLQATLREQADTHGKEPAAVIRGVNRRLCMSAGEGRFATLFYGMLDTATLAMDYANAGHNPPALFHRGPEGGHVLRLRATGTIAGIFPDSAYTQRRIQLHPGDMLVIFSDGVTEAMSEAGEFFEEERLLALLPSLADLPAAEIVDRILDEVTRFAGQAAQADDITLIVARVLP
jgi:sigma-B regulation protein RsbU (phosphoserine phosphatase)